MEGLGGRYYEEEENGGGGEQAGPRPPLHDTGCGGCLCVCLCVCVRGVGRVWVEWVEWDEVQLGLRHTRFGEVGELSAQ